VIAGGLGFGGDWGFGGFGEALLTALGRAFVRDRVEKKGASCCWSPLIKDGQGRQDARWPNGVGWR
jgi:hypothetical protein